MSDFTTLTWNITWNSQRTTNGHLNKFHSNWTKNVNKRSLVEVTT